MAELIQVFRPPGRPRESRAGRTILETRRGRHGGAVAIDAPTCASTLIRPCTIRISHASFFTAAPIMPLIVVPAETVGQLQLITP